MQVLLASGARVHVRARGDGPALVLLHGGWGHEAYPVDAVLTALAPRFRILAPDRVGFGASGRLAALPPRFHARMAEETLSLLDALGLERAALWGHSDGAVVAAWAAILAPSRVSALVLEALHFRKAKPGSLDFFRDGLEAPERFGPRVVEALRRDHGDGAGGWRDVLAMESRAWLAIIDEGLRTGGDLFEGRLGEVRAPTLVLHGREDPRTEPGELEDALRALPGARCALLDCGHSPHTSARAAARCLELAAAFLAAAHGQRWPATP
jgi:pimeloyl-ACP methyl ester carboxylesterase